MSCCCEQAVLDRLEQEDAEHEHPGEVSVPDRAAARQAQTIALTASLVWRPGVLRVDMRPKLQPESRECIKGGRMCTWQCHTSDQGLRQCLCSCIHTRCAPT
jgi:hypothetical protein